SRYTLAQLVSVGVISLIRFFFFFQAEDGIRDLIVTGVQTCALPISAPCRRPSRCRGSSCSGTCRSRCSTPAARTTARARPRTRRSEERRVGKECRARRERDEGRKKREGEDEDGGVTVCAETWSLR